MDESKYAPIRIDIDASDPYQLAPPRFRSPTPPRPPIYNGATGYDAHAWAEHDRMQQQPPPSNYTSSYATGPVYEQPPARALSPTSAYGDSQYHDLGNGYGINSGATAYGMVQQTPYTSAPPPGAYLSPPTGQIDDEKAGYDDQSQVTTHTLGNLPRRRTSADSSQSGRSFDSRDEKTGYGEGEPTNRHFGPAPTHPILRRNKTKKRIALTHGNVVLDCPVPTRLKGFLPRKDEEEFLFMRCVILRVPICFSSSDTLMPPGPCGLS